MIERALAPGIFLVPRAAVRTDKFDHVLLRIAVQGREDARNLTSLRARRRSPGDLEQPPGNRRRNNFCVSVPRTTKRRTLAEKKCGGVRCCPGPKKFPSKFPKTVLAR